MSNLDKQLDKVLDKAFKGIFVDAWKTEEGIMLDAKYREQIKATILAELEAGMPEEKNNTKDIRAIWDDTDFAVDYRLGYNQALADCLEVARSLLGETKNE